MHVVDIKSSTLFLSGWPTDAGSLSVRLSRTESSHFVARNLLRCVADLQCPDAMTADTMPMMMSARAAKARLRPVYIRVYHVSEFLSGGLICLALIASPWAFGTTQPETIRVMDIAGFALGGLLAIKLMIRWWAGYRPMRWGGGSTAGHSGSKVQGEEHRTGSAGGQSSVEDRMSGHEAAWTIWRNLRAETLTRGLAVLTVCILGYCLIGAVNARAEWRPATNSFDYFKCFNWLPHSYDRAQTWQAFWNYLALACVFWAIRDWLVGLTASEERSQRGLEREGGRSAARSVSMPTRLRWLLWVLIVNGAVLGLEGIAQRLSGTNKLLWFMPTHINRDAIDQFGPYAYRSNAAQYFNLLWPVALGFWWTLHRRRGFRSHIKTGNGRVAGDLALLADVRRENTLHESLTDEQCSGSGKDPATRRAVSWQAPGGVAPQSESAAAILPRRALPAARQKTARPYPILIWDLKRGGHHALLICGAIMAACPIMSTSRGGALVAGGLIVSVGAFLLLSAIFLRSQRVFSARSAMVTFSLVCAFFVSASWAGLHFGWADLEPRMMDIDQGYAQREEIYETAGKMARDYSVFGTGPGSFNALFQLYRSSPDEYWPAQLHDDWLETRITWGWAGSALIGLALLVVLARWSAPGGIHGGRRFVVITWLALAGCMIHARFDFPFQIYSIVLLFVAICAVLSTLSRRTTA